MGFFDFFNRKNAVSPADIKIELGTDSIVINGKSVDIPSHIDVLTALFGKPRASAGPKENVSEAMLASKRVNYAWDKLGLYCYTKNGSVIFCLGIRLNEGDICPKHFPSEFFGGTVTINGMPWYEAARTLPNIEEEIPFFKKIALGGYSAVMEYVDFEADPDSRTGKDYTSIEIQLR